MSDDAKDEQAASAPSGDGFTPAPPPPALSEEEAAAATASMEGDTILPDGTITVPQDTAKRALEAVQILVDNNRSASQQLESLMGIVLDAAEVANRSASAVATTGTHVNKAAEKLIEGAKKTSMQAKVVLALAAAVLVGTAGTFSFMTVQLHGKVEQLDEMLLAVGKRAVDLKRRMETMDDIHASLEELNLKQENTQSVQQAIEDKIGRLVDSGKFPTRKETTTAPAEEPAPAPAKPAPEKKSEKPAKREQKAEQKAEQKSEQKADGTDKSDTAGKTPPTSTAKAVSPKKSAPAKSAADEAALLQQLSGLDSLIKEQSRAMRDLSSQVNNLQGSVANVDVIKKDVESIAAQQKQREKEAAQREKEAAQELAAANARREKEAKDKERDLARERERAREREAMRERELAREREATKERELAREREVARDREKSKDKERPVSYNREQSKPNAAASVDGAPSYAKPASKTE